MKNKKIILFFLVASLLTKAEEYNENTITRNNWATIEPDKNKTRVEKITNKIKYEIEYNDGDIIGTKSKQVPQYGTNINNIIEIGKLEYMYITLIVKMLIGQKQY